MIEIMVILLILHTVVHTHTSNDAACVFVFHYNALHFINNIIFIIRLLLKLIIMEDNKTIIITNNK